MNESRHEAMDEADLAPAFAFETSHSTPVRAPRSRWRAWAFPAFFALLVAASVTGYWSTRPEPVDPSASQVVVEVIGMHCPIQCGLRVAKALETLPFVLPDSVTANPRTGIVTFVVTSAEVVDRDRVVRVIEQTGFTVRSVTIPN